MYSDDLLDTPEAQSMGEIIDELDFIKIKNFYYAKGNVERKRRHATDW